jgi:hypothetical protein
MRELLQRARTLEQLRLDHGARYSIHRNSAPSGTSFTAKFNNSRDFFRKA